MTVALVVAGLMSAVGTIAIGIRHEKELSKSRSDVLTGLRSTLIPTAKGLIGAAPRMDEQTLIKCMTELTARCAVFVKDHDDDVPDANVYLLRGESKLERVNDSAGKARPSFTKSKRRDDRSREETAVVDRVLACTSVTCDDIYSPKHQRDLVLAPGERTYRAFISVPIIGPDHKPRGMISLNSSKVGRLTRVHEIFLEQLAELVAEIDAVNRTNNRS